MGTATLTHTAAITAAGTASLVDQAVSLKARASFLNRIISSIPQKSCLKTILTTILNINEAEWTALLLALLTWTNPSLLVPVKTLTLTSRSLASQSLRSPRIHQLNHPHTVSNTKVTSTTQYTTHQTSSPETQGFSYWSQIQRRTCKCHKANKCGLQRWSLQLSWSKRLLRMIMLYWFLVLMRALRFKASQEWKQDLTLIISQNCKSILPYRHKTLTKTWTTFS